MVALFALLFSFCCLPEIVGTGAINQTKGTNKRDGGFFLNVGKIQQAAMGMKAKKTKDGNYEAKPSLFLGGYDGNWWTLQTADVNGNLPDKKGRMVKIPLVRAFHIRYNDYMFAVPAKIGTPGQSLTLMLSTQLDKILVKGSECTSFGCVGECVTKFNRSLSVTNNFQAGQPYECCDCLKARTIGNFVFSGKKAKDKVVVGDVVLDDQEIIIGTVMEIAGVAGALGLRPNPQSFIKNLENRQMIGRNSSYVGVWIDPKTLDGSNQTSAAGELTVGCVDETRFIPPLQRLGRGNEEACEFSASKIKAILPNGDDILCFEKDVTCTVKFDFSSTSYIYLTGTNAFINELKTRNLAEEKDGVVWVCCDLGGLPTLEFSVTTDLKAASVDLTLEPKHYTYKHPSREGCWRVLAIRELECERTSCSTCRAVLGGVFFTKYYMVYRLDKVGVGIAVAKH